MLIINCQFMEDPNLNPPDDIYKNLISQMDQGYILVEVLFDTNDNPVDILYIEANAAANRMTGTGLAGKRTSELDPNYEQHWYNTFGRIAKTGIAEKHELSAAPLGVYYQFRGFKVGAPDERKVAVFYEDVTERRLAQSATEALRKSEEQFRLFVTASSIMVYKMSADWKEMHLLNGKDVLADTEQVNGNWADKYIPEEDQPFVWQAIAQAISSKTAFKLEHRVILADGAIGWVYSRAVPVLDAQGEITEWFGSGNDITKRKQAGAALLKSEQRFKISSAKYLSLFNSIDQGFCIIEMIFAEDGTAQDYRFLETNPAFDVQTGLRNATGKTMRGLAPDHEEYWYQIYGEVAVSGKPKRFEAEALALQSWFDVYAFGIDAPEQHHVALLFNNITAKKEAEDQQILLLKLSDTLRTLSDPVTVQAEAMHMLGEHLRASRALYIEVEPDGDTCVIHRDYFNGVPSVAGRHALSGYGKQAREKWLSGQTVVYADVEADESLSADQRTIIAAAQVRSWLGVPLLKNGQLAAILAVQQSVPRSWTADEISLAEEVAERTWAAVERANAQEALRISEGRLQRIVNLPRIGVLTFDYAGKLLTANDAFLEITGYDRREIERLQLTWRDFTPPEYVAASVEVMKQLQTTGRGGPYEKEYFHKNGTRLWMMFVAADLGDGTLAEYAIDISDRKLAERQLQELNDHLEQQVTERTAELTANYNLFQATLDSNLGMIQVFEAVRDQHGKIIDFEWILNNATSELINGNVIGKRLLETNPGFEQEGVFAKFAEVTETGVPQQYDIHYVHEQFDGWFHQSVVKLNGGVATNTVNITERKRAEQEIKDQAHFVQSITDIMPDILTVIELPSRRIIYNNRDTLVLLGFEADEIAKMSFDERTMLFHPEDLPDIQAFYERFSLMDDGEINQLEYRLKNNKQEWTIIALRGQVFKRNKEGTVTQALFIGQDVTQRKEAEAALQQSRDRLQSVLDTTLIGMSVFAPVKDAQGTITDFRIMIVNKKIERSAGRDDLVGQLYTKLYPGIKQMGLFDLMVETIETGQPGQMEYHYNYEGIDRWYSTMFVKGEDILVSTNLDITDRKLFEQKHLRDFVLLQQSEELAATGSWDYDLLTGNFIWSDGMYRLFNLQQGKEVKPEIYLQYATADCLDIAARVAGHIKHGDTEFEETLKINVGSNVKVVKLKAALIKNEEGRPVRVLGVDMDVTASRLAQEKLRQMEEAQLLEIFRVTLRTQEEERRRISESLHNGLGQMLYGIKISLSQLNVKSAIKTPEEFETSKRYTNDLLSEAIRDSRRISHDLMPAVLEEFGLKAAVKDVCEQMQDGVKFRCSIELGDIQIDNYMQLAVFRTLQELMINVVKHAQATQARADVRYHDEQIQVRVTDNGKGIDPEKQGNDGIGLASIRSKADLLNGKLDIKSLPGKGTSVKVVLPYIPVKTN